MIEKKMERIMIICTIIYILLLSFGLEFLDRSEINLRYIKLPYRISTGLGYIIGIIIWLLSMALFLYLEKTITKIGINKSIKKAIKLSNQGKGIKSNEILEEILENILVREKAPGTPTKDSIYLHIGYNYFNLKEYKNALHYFKLGKIENPNNKLILEYITKINKIVDFQT